jgi:peptide/nickel transport system substrate-binding protein
MAKAQSTLGHLYESLKAGDISRREFMKRASATGIGAGMALFMANAAIAGGGKNGFALYQGQDGTPSASPAASPATGAFDPAAGMEGRTRGEGGELRLIQWQAPTSANAHTGTGTKDFLAGQLVQEPLFEYLPDGSIFAKLAAEVPSVENGMLAEDLTAVTFKLKEGVVWSDGEPFTAKDVVFTWQWVTNPDNAAVSAEPWSVIESIEAVDDLTAQVTFTQPAAAWFEAFTGGTLGPILPSHAFGDDPANRNVEFDLKPLGTGPFVIEEFRPNDQVSYVANENYREPNKPFFATVILKGGGEAAAAARAVMQTGEYHYAWNLQVEPAVLQEIDADGEFGTYVVAQGSSLERIHINFSDPWTEVDGQVSEMNTPHPFLSDPAVREALSFAADRQTIADEFYGEGQPPTSNILTGLESWESPNTSWEYNLEKAAQILDDAGWTREGEGIRSKDGVELRIVYATSVNAVRQKTQAVIKQSFESIGVGVQLEQIDAAIYFDGSEGNPQNINKFPWDIDMYTNSPSSPVPISFLVSWYAGPDRENIAQESNGWQGQNFQRWVNEEYDAKFEELQSTTDMEKATQLMIEMNDLVINDHAVIPLVNRSVDTYAYSTQLREENLQLGPFHDLTYWNIANWNFADGVEA